MNGDDFYAILGIGEDADDAEIRSAYRQLARKYHPDAGPGSSEERFRRIQGAYEILSDPGKRREYDRSRRPVESRPGPRPFPRRTGVSPIHLDLRNLGRSAGPPPEPLIPRRR